MSTDFTEGEPPKSGVPSMPMATGFSEGIPETRPAQSSRSEDDEPADRSLKHDSDDSIVGIIAHWGGGLTWFVAPLIMYVIQKDKRSLAAWHAREAMNFQLTSVIYYLLPTPLFCLVFLAIAEDSPLLFVLAVFLPVGLMVFIAIYELVIIIWASIAAYRGRYFRIPLIISFVPRTPIPSPLDAHADLD